VLAHIRLLFFSDTRFNTFLSFRYRFRCRFT